MVHKYLGPIANPEVARKIKELKKEKSVPEEYYYLFWDTDPKKIDMKKNSRYVIEKVLEMGNLDALQWIQRIYPTNLIIETLEISRKITHKSKNFWAIWFNKEYAL